MNESIKTKRQTRNTRRGGAIVEFALTMPLLLIMAAGAADFARIFLQGTAMAGAAASAVKYGAQDAITSAEFTEMETLAAESSEDVPDAEYTAERLCDCPDAPGEWVDCLSTICPLDYGLPRAYVRVDVTKTFTTLATIPGVPNNVPITLRGYMRVQ